MNVIIAWLVSFMVTVAPVTRAQYIPAAKESPEEAQARYESIASDIVSVVWNPENDPLFGGDQGRSKTATTILGIMRYESDFRKDVDYGLGDQGVGDGGRSYCLMQIRTGSNRTYAWNKVQKRFALPNDPADQVVQGWTGKELVQDRKKCIETGYRLIKASFKACHALPVTEWLRAYASGTCENGSSESRTRMSTGINWFNKNRPSFSDSVVMVGLRSRSDTNLISTALASAP